MIPSWLRNRLHTIRFVFFLLVVLPQGLAQTAITPDDKYQEIAQKLAPFIEHELKDKQLPALSIALVEDQKIVWAQGFGFADPVHKVPATAETVYRVGSVSKLFTDIAVMQQVERGKLDLDAPLSKYLPDFHPANPFNSAPITLRQLMSHRSGLLREPPVGHYFDATEPSLKATINSLAPTTLVYPPGEHTKYSNAAIATVGFVLEAQAKRPFVDVVRDSVLKPMGLNSSAFEPTPKIRSRLAKSYMWTYHGRTFDAPTFQLGMAPAGSMYSTVLDLGRFVSILLAGGRARQTQIIQPATLQKMWTPQFGKPDDQSGFGIGFHLAKLNGQQLVGHGGAIYGFATEVEALPDAKLGVAVVTTMDSANPVVTRIAHETLRMALAKQSGQPVDAPATTTEIDPATSHQLAGRYGDGDDAVELVEEEGQLYLLPFEGGLKTRLRKLGDDLIVDDKLGYGDRIGVKQDLIEVSGKVLKRVEMARPTPAPQDWNGLIGEYGWDHDVLYILERNGKLTSLIEWYEYEPLEQITNDRFRYPRRGLYDAEEVVFTRGEKGVATQVKVGEVVFKRRAIGPEGGQSFHIAPVKPVAELREAALKAQPPQEKGSFRKADLVELIGLDSTIKLDIRYATNNNFLSTPMYRQAKAFMQRPAAEAVVRANRRLQQSGYGLLIHDAYRPWYVTKMFWEATPQEDKIFVADPAQGSRHNRGCAVDLTLYELKTGQPVQTVGVYDEMSDRSFPFYPGGTSEQRWYRDLLRNAMEAEGFRVYEAEWWHFDYKDWPLYPIGNQEFEQLSH